MEAVPEQRNVRLVDYSDDEDTSRRVVFLSQDEPIKSYANEIHYDCDSVKQMMSCLNINCSFRSLESIFLKVNCI